ncbi:MAG: hypothetical protein HYY12_06030 [Candidatus Methylomirabilis oxyfera]|nr:hypothetical protein [Candidatus Methylomirabilis oxyfera]
MDERQGSSQQLDRRRVLRALAGSLLGFLVGSRSGRGPAAHAAEHGGRALPAIPRRPRPATLSPALFQGKTARAYRIAREVPELIEQMPCYCGCFKSHRHQNNLDCYVDRHAFG